MNLSKLWEIVKDREACVLKFMASQRAGHNLVTEHICIYIHIYIFNIKLYLNKNMCIYMYFLLRYNLNT